MKIKKTILLLCCVIIASLGIVLTGCGSSNDEGSSDVSTEISGDVSAESSSDASAESGSDASAESGSEKNDDGVYVGTWAATVVDYEGDEYSADEFIGPTKFVFNADGTGDFIGDGMSTEIQWEPTEDGVKFSDFGGEEYLTYKDGKLLLDVNLESGGFITVYLEKQA